MVQESKQHYHVQENRSESLNSITEFIMVQEFDLEEGKAVQLFHGNLA